MIVFDFEVFKEDWMVVFLDLINRKETVVVNDREKLTEFHKEHKEDIFIGFNNTHYDNFIFKGIILGLDPTDINKHIIVGKESGYSYSDLFWNVPLIAYDTMTSFHGLKTLEGFMGHSIEETSVDFTIDRKLTDSEIEEVVEYCRYDVKETTEVFLRTQDAFNTKMDLIREFKLPLHNIGRSNAQLSAEVLDCTLQPRTDEWQLDFPKELEIEKYDEIIRWFKNPLNRDKIKFDSNGNPQYSKNGKVKTVKQKLEIDIFGVPHVIAWGGIHGARDSFIEEGKFVLADISSFYPSLMIQYNYHSRNMSHKNNFKEMYDERFRLKKIGDKKEGSYKLVLN